jgi:hypothetical protein
MGRLVFAVAMFAIEREEFQIVVLEMMERDLGSAILHSPNIDEEEKRNGEYLYANNFS